MNGTIRCAYTVAAIVITVAPIAMIVSNAAANGVRFGPNAQQARKVNPSLRPSHTPINCKNRPGVLPDSANPSSPVLPAE